MREFYKRFPEFKECTKFPSRIKTIVSQKFSRITKAISEQNISHVTDRHHTCQPSRIIRESPGYDTNLLVSRTGRFISRIKSSFELFCALV